MKRTFMHTYEFTNRSTSNQVWNAFQTLFFTDFAADSQNSGKR